MQQVAEQQPLAGVAVRQHRERHHDEGVRHSYPEGFYGIHHAHIRAERLKKKILCPQRRELLCCKAVGTAGRGGLRVQSRAEVRKDGGVLLGGGVAGQLPARLRQLFPARHLGRCHPGQAEGIGLDSLCARRQILGVDPLHPFGVGKVRQLAFYARRGLIIGTHAAVEQQRLMGKILSDVRHRKVLLFLRFSLYFSRLPRDGAFVQSSSV